MGAYRFDLKEALDILARDKQARVVVWDEEEEEADWSPSEPSVTFFVNGAEVVGISLSMGNGSNS
jgi:hypothetical protein